jgi:hypothetical protein
MQASAYIRNRDGLIHNGVLNKMTHAETQIRSTQTEHFGKNNSIKVWKSHVWLLKSQAECQNYTQGAKFTRIVSASHAWCENHTRACVPHLVIFFGNLTLILVVSC